MSEQWIPRWRVKLIREPTEAYQQLSNMDQVVERFDFLREETVECFYVAFLDIRNGIIGMQEVARGTINKLGVQPRDVFQAAILANCTNIILVHNHTSGDPSPSNEDRSLTRMLAQAGDLLGIHVVDHVITGDQESYSFLTAGELNPPNRRGNEN